MLTVESEIISNVQTIDDVDDELADDYLNRLEEICRNKLQLYSDLYSKLAKHKYYRLLLNEIIEILKKDLQDIDYAKLLQDSTPIDMILQMFLNYFCLICKYIQ